MKCRARRRRHRGVCADLGLRRAILHWARIFPLPDAATPAGGVANDRFPTHLITVGLMRVLGETEEGRGRLSKLLRLCSPLDSAAQVETLISYAQQPWFLMAEGDFPFPSTYITFAVGNNDFPMPAWPVRVACDHVGRDDFGVDPRRLEERDL